MKKIKSLKRIMALLLVGLCTLSDAPKTNAGFTITQGDPCGTDEIAEGAGEDVPEGKKLEDVEGETKYVENLLRGLVENARKDAGSWKFFYGPETCIKEFVKSLYEIYDISGDGRIKSGVTNGKINNAIWYLHQIFRCTLSPDDYQRVKFYASVYVQGFGSEVGDYNKYHVKNNGGHSIHLSDILPRIRRALDLLQSGEKYNKGGIFSWFK